MNQKSKNIPSPAEPILEHVMDGLVDYAGLFPPSSCSLEETLKNYAKFLKSNYDWMLGRIIIPCEKLKNSIEFLKRSNIDHESDIWVVSALVGEAGTDKFLDDIDSIYKINDLNSGLVVDVIETKVSNGNSIDSVLDDLPEDIFPFFEIDLTNDSRGILTALSGDSAGLKFRTGGMIKSAYPSSKDLALAIKSSVNIGIPFKATAGLHHPFSSFNVSVGIKEFGFFDLLLASLVAAQGKTLEEIERVLTSDNFSKTSFEMGCIKYDEYKFSINDIIEIRERGFLSFGSCSFDEPCQDLRKVGWL